MESAATLKVPQNIEMIRLWCVSCSLDAERGEKVPAILRRSLNLPNLVLFRDKRTPGGWEATDVSADKWME